VTAGTAGAHNRGMSGVLYFDGVCGMCTRAVRWIDARDRTGGVEIRPFQQPGTAALLGVSDEHMRRSSWWLDATGAVYDGAEAINAAVSAALGTRLPLRLYRTVGVRSVQDVAYRWIATHRYRFRGVTPYCESHPVAC
jgi:predicted DCC family thiol-disulfide oxidoreductase YuxK